MALDHQRVKSLFLEVVDLPPAEAGRRLAAAEPELAAAVAELLDFHDDAPLFVDEAPAPVGVDPLGIVGRPLAGHRVDAFVAEGGFAMVYRGASLRTGQARALKILKEGQPGDLPERWLEREAALLRQLGAELPVLVGVEGVRRCTLPAGAARLVLILEWLEGAPLAVPEGGLALPAIIGLLTPVVDALVVAHARGVAHRDIKAGNLFVEPDGALRLLDFGVAKVAGDHTRGFQSTASVGSAFTLRSAAPEQLTGAATGPWTDVWGVALLCVELLLGRHPFEGLSVFETMMAVVDPERRPTPAMHGVAVQAPVEAALGRALAVAPDARPTLAELWAELRAAVG